LSDDQAAAQDTTGNARRPTRSVPFPIVLIAVFQFVKAGFLLYLFLQFWRGYSGWDASGRPDSPFLRGFLDTPFIILFPVLSVVFVVVGWGLLNLRAWARKFLIGTIICIWIGSRYGNHLSLDALFFSNSVNLRHERLEIWIGVFLLDFFVFCSLVFYPDIAKTFGEKEGEEII
jgi:hypothetical protein